MFSVAIVATVRNERPSIDEWLAALEHQSRAADRIIVVDGGSTDGTWERVRQWSSGNSGVRIALQRQNANISMGRNWGIQHAQTDVIVVTDAGTIAAPEWLELLTDPFENPDVDVVAGFFHPVLQSRWDRALAATTLPDPDELDPETFQPSSRSVALRRSWFDAGIRYPEWLDYCEDLVFDLSLRRAGAKFAFQPDARVAFRVRPNVTSFFTQYRRYARGDGKAGLFARRHVIRYVTYLALLIVGCRGRRHEYLLSLFLAAAYIRAPIVRLIRRDTQKSRSLFDSLTLIPLIALLRGIGDVAKMTGYPAGLAWRFQRYGTLGWRTTWKRVSPDGRLWRPGSSTRENLLPTSSHVVESQVGSS